MFKLAKTKKSSYWHIVEDGINETLCGKTVYSSWMEKDTKNLPSNVCKDCLDMFEEGESALPVKTHPHHTW